MLGTRKSQIIVLTLSANVNLKVCTLHTWSGRMYKELALDMQPMEINFGLRQDVNLKEISSVNILKMLLDHSMEK